MINLSHVSSRSVLGRVLRWPLRLIPGGTVARVLQGPLRGARWVVGSTNHGAWLGSYELAKQRLFAKALLPGFTVWDVGANVGFYTLLASRLVGASGRVSAFEPLPGNVDALRRHLDLNGVVNATIIEKAVSDRDGVSSFQPMESNAQGRLADGGALRVDTITFETYWRLSGEVPDIVKIDIEGGEAAALTGGVEFLKACRPVVFLATHSPDLHLRCCEMLRGLGYGLSPVDAAVPLESTDEIVATWAGNAAP